MAEFVEDFNSFRSPITLMGMDPSLELMNNFPGLSATVMENSSLGMVCFSNDDFLSQQPDFPLLYIDGSPALLPMRSPLPMPEMQPLVPAVGEGGGTSERDKALTVVDSACRLGSALPPKNGSVAEVRGKKKSTSGRGKRERCSGKEKREVVHVRAKRGQATDRHSLAERVRRGKINEKMRCLQGLVPGCYKAMGMAMMLDEIIKYVRSLHNQVEFLSMKLSTASAVYDFSLDQLDDAVAMMPQLLPRVSDADEAQEVDRLMRGRYEGCTSFHPTMSF